MAPSSPLLILLLLLLICIAFSSPALAKSVNSTKILAKFDRFSTFNKYLSETGVVKEVDTRSSITLFIPPNSALDPVISSIGASNLLVIADILRYHCLLQYLEVPEMKAMTNTTGILLTTLFQTTGRAVNQNGFVRLAVTPGGGGAVRLFLADDPAVNSTVVKNITQHPYDMSYVEIDKVLMPKGLGIAQGGADSGVNNLTAVLKSKGEFNTFLGLLASTGVDKALRSMSAVTLLAPTDDAFKAVPPSTMDSLTQLQKIALLQFHAIPTYFTLGSLQSVTTPLPTLASATSGGFAVNVSAAGGKGLSFVTPLNKAEMLETEMDNPPVAVYSINRVLLPAEIFSSAASGPSPAEAPSPVSSPISGPSPSPSLMSPTPEPSSSPSPVPSSGPSPSPISAPTPAPLAASPPAPPAETPAGGSAFTAPETAPNAAPNAAPRGVRVDPRAVPVLLLAVLLL